MICFSCSLKKSFVILGLCAAFAMVLSAGAAEKNLLPDPAFELPQCWIGLDSSFRFEPGGGRNLTTGLVCRRENKAQYSVPAQRVQVVPGKLYRFSVLVKTDGPLNGDGAALCMELYSENGEWRRTISAPRRITDAPDWQRIEGTFKVPPDERLGVTYRYSCYLTEGTTGTVRFDDGRVVEIRDVYDLVKTYPAGGKLYPDGKLRLNAGRDSAEINSRDCAELLCRARIIGKDGSSVERVSPLGEHGNVEFSFGTLPEGEAVLEVFLEHRDGKRALTQLRQPLRIESAPPAAGVTIGEDNVTRIDGKPYMPLGFYIYNTEKSQLDLIADSPFDLILPYNSFGMRFDSSPDDPAAAMLDVMDYCRSRNLKMIFSLTEMLPPGTVSTSRDTWNGISGQEEILARVIALLKDHPALFAWYLCDETDVGHLDTLIARREMLNRLDPHHPTLGVFYQPESIRQYMKCCDLLGVDPYPISRNSFSSMKSIDTMFELTENTRMPVIGVPQIFNSGIYDPEVRRGDMEKFRREYRYPTETQMKAMALREAIGGAKGFLFYSFFDLSAGPDGKAQLERRWPEILRLGTMLRELEPFLLSSAPAPRVMPEVERGTVAARCFSDGRGRVCLAVTATGPGESEAILALSPEFDDFRSTTGAVVNLGGGRYRFRGYDIAYDLLFAGADGAAATVK